MDTERLISYLKAYKQGAMAEGELLKRLKALPYQDIGCAMIDTHRSLRFGFPEVVFGQGKSIESLKKIVGTILHNHRNVIVTRVEPSVAARIRKSFPRLFYHAAGRILFLRKEPAKRCAPIVVVSAGTSDSPVAEEAAIVCEILGNGVERLYDVGVAGLHRLLDKVEILQQARCLIVVAGMEGALPSVVGGLVGKPVIGVPTSVGYGTGFGGVAPLLTMLNSCSPNVVVVNIDNGFGAAFFAHLITQKGDG